MSRSAGSRRTCGHRLEFRVDVDDNYDKVHPHRSNHVKGRLATDWTSRTLRFEHCSRFSKILSNVHNRDVLPDLYLSELRSREKSLTLVHRCDILVIEVSERLKASSTYKILLSIIGTCCRRRTPTAMGQNVSTSQDFLKDFYNLVTPPNSESIRRQLEHLMFQEGRIKILEDEIEGWKKQVEEQFSAMKD
jgi:hypothetical protein